MLVVVNCEGNFIFLSFDVEILTKHYNIPTINKEI